jgi:hypothetical protein
MAHRRLADEVLDSLADSQSKFNSLTAQLTANPKASGNTSVAAHAIADIFEADGEGSGAQHKASLRKSMRSALAHKRLADEICDALEEFAVAQNALVAKLDADLATGAYDETDYEASLALEVVDADAEGSEAQHKASLRKSLRSALSHRRLADEIIDAIAEAQSQYNAALAILDTAYIAGAFDDVSVSELDPDA